MTALKELQASVLAQVLYQRVAKRKVTVQKCYNDVSATVYQDVGDTEDSLKKVLLSDKSKIDFWLSY